MRGCGLGALLLPWPALNAARAAEEPYPNRPIRIIIPFTAGGPIEIVGRPVAEAMQRSLGQAVIIESRPGANGVIGATQVARGAADGYTILLTTGSHTANPSILKDLPFDALKDFKAISQVAAAPYGQALVVRPTLDAKTVAELVALANKMPGKLTYGHAGAGNVTHIAGELFKYASKADIVSVPYKGSAAVVNDLLGGHVDMAFLLTPLVGPFVKEGKLRVLAVTGEKRTPAMPNAPTFIEAGLPDVVMPAFFGLLAPAGTPEPIVKKLSDEVSKAVHDPAVVRVLEMNELIPVGSSSAEFEQYMIKDLAYQAAIIKKIGFEPINAR